MKIIRHVDDMRKWSFDQYLEDKIALVYVKGAIHEGHLAVIREAKLECDLVVVCIFCNRLEFDSEEAFERFPKDQEEADKEKLFALQYVDVLFIPRPDELYYKGTLSGALISYHDALTEAFEGRLRPEKYTGLCTILVKFIGIIQPTHLFLGRNCIQSVCVVRALLADLLIPVQVRTVAQMREAGSNVCWHWSLRLLGEEERRAAGKLFECLQMISHLYVKGERKAEKLISDAKLLLAGDPLIQVDYVSIVIGDHLRDIEVINPAEGAWALAAITVNGKFHLVDNVRLAPQRPSLPFFKRLFCQRTPSPVPDPFLF